MLGCQLAPKFMYLLLHFHIPGPLADPLESGINFTVELEAFTTVTWLVDRYLHDIATELWESVIDHSGHRPRMARVPFADDTHCMPSSHLVCSSYYHRNPPDCRQSPTGCA